MFQVKLAIRPPSSWALDMVSKHDVPIVILDCIPHGDSGAEGLIELEGDRASREQVISSMRNHPDILGIELASDSDSKTVASVMAKNWVTCSAILKSDCYLRGARTLQDGRVEWNLLVKDERSLSKLLLELGSAECQAEILSKVALKEPFALTRNQERVIRAALEQGYYDFPRRVTGKQLAKRLGISPSTLSEILQRAERKLAEFYFNFRL